MTSEDLTQVTADIVAAHVSNNAVGVEEVPTLIRNVHEALSGLSADGKPEKVPAVSIRASVKPDYLVCLVCGRQQKMLKRHLRTAHDMTPEQYRQDYGLRADYPMASPNYAEKRRKMAIKIGLGRKPSLKRRRKSGGKGKAKGEG